MLHASAHHRAAGHAAAPHAVHHSVYHSRPHAAVAHRAIAHATLHCFRMGIYGGRGEGETEGSDDSCCKLVRTFHLIFPMQVGS